ncbi:MAG TPA: recombinase family protein [Phycisphaerae bacterium]|nr:recombinase family protein [Phycisphaerae bacterium]HRW51584.1 recombinase family protein [Phycisphaerae bacterium]
MKRAYAYLRASTDRQDASVPAQREAIFEFCGREGIEVVDWFSDDGVSGKSFDRSDYRRMRALIVGGNPDNVGHVIVWSLSRFARVNPDDYIVEKRDLAKAGVTIVSTTEGIRGESGIADGLLSYISAHQNHEYLVKLSKDVTRGMRALVQNGFWPSVAPLGYDRLVVDNGHNPVEVNGKPLILKRGQLKGSQNHVVLVPGHETEQAAIRFIFEKRAFEKWGLRRIAADLNEMGIKTLKGSPWRKTTVRSVLNNIVYLGHTRYGVRRKHKGIRNQIGGVELKLNPKEEWITVENTHEALISADTFEKAQATLRGTDGRADRALGGKRKLMLFSSMIECKHCGANYQCRPRSKNGKRYEYYECSGRDSGRTKRRCDCWSLNSDKLKNFIFGEIDRRVSTEEFQVALRAYLVGRLGQLIRSEVFDTRQLDREIQEVETKKRRVIDSIADGVLSPDDSTVASKLAELDDQMLLLTTRKQEILKVTGVNIDPDEIALRLIERVRNLTAFLESQDVEAQRKALFAFCKRIVADAETREVVVETDLTGLAQGQSVPGLPAALSSLNAEGVGAQENAQRAAEDELCNLDLPE